MDVKSLGEAATGAQNGRLVVSIGESLKECIVVHDRGRIAIKVITESGNGLNIADPALDTDNGLFGIKAAEARAVCRLLVNIQASVHRGGKGINALVDTSGAVFDELNGAPGSDGIDRVVGQLNEGGNIVHTGGQCTDVDFNKCTLG